MGGEMNMRSSMSLSFVASHVCVGVPSFVSVRFMSSMISCSRIPPGLFPKLSCLLLKSPVSMMLFRPKQNPSMISLEGLPVSVSVMLFPVVESLTLKMYNVVGRGPLVFLLDRWSVLKGSYGSLKLS